MHSRLSLHEALCTALGSRHCYYQPPESVKMIYPAIVYKFQGLLTRRANNKLYLNAPSFMVTLIDSNPDSIIPDAILEIPYCQFDRHYISENLNHWVFTIYVNKDNKTNKEN